MEFMHVAWQGFGLSAGLGGVPANFVGRARRTEGLVWQQEVHEHGALEVDEGAGYDAVVPARREV